MPLHATRSYTTVEELIEMLKRVAVGNPHKKVVIRELSPPLIGENQAIEITDKHPHYIVLIGF